MKGVLAPVPAASDRWAALRRPAVKRGIHAAWNLVLLALWGKFYWPLYPYLAILFTKEEFRTNQILLMAVAALLFLQARKTRFTLRLDAAPRLELHCLALALGGSLAFLLVERYLNINTLSAFLFGLASYGLLGLWMEPARWRRGFPAMLLVVGVLPFGEHLETFVGYPVRALTAALVRDAFFTFGIHSVGADTILVFESGISQVDIPCSGMKSLWTGALFLLAATWIKNIPIGFRWLLVAVVTALLLLAANFLRVFILALAGPVMGWTLLAQMLHVPAGVLGFLFTCAAAAFMLDRLPGWPEEAAPQKTVSVQRPGWLRPLLVLSLLGFVLAYVPRASVAAEAPAEALAWAFPSELHTQIAPLSAQELQWIHQNGAETADRYTFQWQAGGEPVRGTLMLLTSQTWRGQHRPERCFEVFGLTVRESSTHLVSPAFPLRALALSGAGVSGQPSAVYWLQSASQTTEDFGKRIWADLSPNRERWVLVTVLFDRPFDTRRPEMTNFLTALHASLTGSLGSAQEGGGP